MLKMLGHLVLKKKCRTSVTSRHHLKFTPGSTCRRIPRSTDPAARQTSSSSRSRTSAPSPATRWATSRPRWTRCLTTRCTASCPTRTCSCSLTRSSRWTEPRFREGSSAKGSGLIIRLVFWISTTFLHLLDSSRASPFCWISTLSPFPKCWDLNSLPLDVWLEWFNVSMYRNLYGV